MELIAATPLHAEVLAGMHRICFAEPWGPQAMIDLLAMPGAAGLIAVDGASLVPAAGPPGPAGLVLWRAAAGEAEILTIAVLPPWRRRGLGGRLVQAAADRAAAAGATVLFLEVDAGNRAGLALYGRRGFTAVGRRKGYYGGNDALIMRKDLDTTSSGS
ncbi:GNAT family N-acetyltransferase [Magnetospirillum sp. UT-4]|uniref:GNAT family N-acetyltransferase n=1 Tax=Magnetospirillum sp. UT-4 TaxID=2681467 RepID=UPI00138232D6|nr:GNAT family N-acetyltransferase [Magnetospirillum sp. UT-4]CAA7624521.1 Acetyltransferase [Magnetospirillum sp. UT-4]